MQKIPYVLKVGNKYYTSAGWSFSYNRNTDCRYITVREEGISDANYPNSNISDKWTNTSVLISIAPDGGITDYDELIQGNIHLELVDKLETYFANQVRPSALHLERLLIKNITIEIIDSRTGNVTGNDGVNTKVVLSTNLTGKNPLIINTTTGIGTYGNSRAAFKTDAQTNVGMNLTGLIRSTSETGGTAYNTSKLILQSIISQYKQPRFKLNGVLNVKNYLLDTDLYLIRDSKYLTGKSFYITNGKYSDYEESFDVEMIELVSSRDNIE